MKNANIIYCSQCVMDSVGDEEFELNENGICNYCVEYREKEVIRLIPNSIREKELNKIVKKIREKGEKKEYDCLVGVSGGVDSTYTAYLAKSLGLRPLAVHFDNGWNSELAVKNIQQVLEVLKIDLVTYVVNWDEFRDLQVSFLKSSTPDGEIPTDHGILATLFNIASKYGIKFILSGNNFKTEGVMPRLWAYGHMDWKYISNVHKIYGKRKLKSFPRITLTKLFYFFFVKNIKIISILNYIDYQKDEVKRVLEKKLNWKYYGGKHYESVYTKFYQGIVLPEKFKIDKRKLHLSALILSGQMSRRKAQEYLNMPIYPTHDKASDTDYVLKKLELTKEEWTKILQTERRTFEQFSNMEKLLNSVKKLIALLRRKKIIYN